MDREHYKTIRGTIVRLWMAGLSTRVISWYTGASISTVYRWVRRWQEMNGITKGRRRRRVRPCQYLREVMSPLVPTRKIFGDMTLPMIPSTKPPHHITFPYLRQSNPFYAVRPSTKVLPGVTLSGFYPSKPFSDLLFHGFHPNKSLHGLFPSTKGLADIPQSSPCPVKVTDVLPSSNSCHGLQTLGLHSTKTLQQNHHTVPTFPSNHFLHSLSLW